MTGDTVEVIVTDAGADSGTDALGDFAEGMLVGAAAATAAEASETADTAAAEASMAIAAAVSVESRIDELQAVVIGLYDEMRERDTVLADALGMLLDEVTDAEMEAANAAAAAEQAADVVTEVAAETAPDDTQDTQDTEGSESGDDSADNAAATDAASGEPEHHQRAGNRRLGFRRGRR